MASKLVKLCALVVFALLIQAWTGSPTVSSASTATQLNSRGSDLYEKKQWEEAATLFLRAYELEPNTPIIRQNLMNAAMMFSQSLFDSGDAEGAIEWLEIAVQSESNNVRPLNQLATYLLSEGETSSAIFRLEEAIELESENLESRFLLGLAYYKDNDVTAAINQWEWIYSVDKDYPGLIDRLESALRDEKVEMNFRGTGSRNFNVTYDRNTTTDQVRDAINILEKAYRETGRTLGGIYPPTPIQVSLYTLKGFSDSTQAGEHIAALYDGTKIRCPVMDADGNPISHDVLRERLAHEYVHVIVSHVAKNNIPWWFNEGLAETLSTTISKREKQILAEAYAGRRLFDLETISPPDTLNQLDAEQLELAYAQSHVTVDFLYRKYGANNIRQMLESLGEGMSAEDSLREAYHMSYSILESQSHSFMTRL